MSSFSVILQCACSSYGRQCCVITEQDEIRPSIQQFLIMTPGGADKRRLTVVTKICDILYGCEIQTENELALKHNMRVCTGN
jgi:hypothetical protein